MDTVQSLLYGFSVSLTPMNLLYCALGVLLGTLVGVLPGIGPLGGITLLLPTTFGMEPISAIIMLAGIYYGAMYGGSTTSILVNIPGEAASVVTCFDGYQMARQGRAGPALGPGPDVRHADVRASSETLTTPYLSQACSACSVRNSYSFSRSSSTRSPAASIAPT